MKEIWPHYHIGSKNFYEAQVCSFDDIFSDIWSAAYYSKTWSKMIAADAFLIFKDCQTDEDLANMGQR